MKIRFFWLQTTTKKTFKNKPEKFSSLVVHILFNIYSPKLITLFPSMDLIHLSQDSTPLALGAFNSRV